MPVLIRHLWQFKTVVFLHWCLICVVLLNRVNLKIPIIYHPVQNIDSKKFCEYNPYLLAAVAKMIRALTK
jgi:hypothetical protein